MSLNATFKSLKTAALLGGILGLSFGCIIDISPLEPCESGSNNKLNDDGECECRIGYDWCTDDPADLNCCDLDEDTNGDDVDTTTSSDDDTTNGDDVDTTSETDTSSETDSTTGDDTTDTGVLPPESCTPEEEGFYWCTHTEEMGPQGSQFFICEGGSWVENGAFMDETCMFDGYDFAYGCVDDGVDVIFECGDGSGSDCAEDPAYCIDGDQIAYCYWGKETWESCQNFCENIGIDGVTYEYGECDESDPEDVSCYCCDADDPECPINN